MKSILFTLLGLCLFALASVAQQADIPPSKPGQQYGKKTDARGALTVQELEKKLATASTYQGKVQGEVVQVCKKKGCFVTLKRENSDDAVMVRFTDYEYFMPQDIVGKTIVVDGRAKVKETSVDMQKHYAEDLGKSKEEIASIKEPKRDISFVADGVIVVK